MFKISLTRLCFLGSFPSHRIALWVFVAGTFQRLSLWAVRVKCLTLGWGLLPLPISRPVPSTARPTLRTYSFTTIRNIFRVLSRVLNPMDGANPLRQRFWRLTLKSPYLHTSPAGGSRLFEKSHGGTAAPGCPAERKLRSFPRAKAVELRSTGQPGAAVPTRASCNTRTE